MTILVQCAAVLFDCDGVLVDSDASLDDLGLAAPDGATRVRVVTDDGAAP